MRVYKEEDFTEWFPPEVKPVHFGPFQTKLALNKNAVGFQYWGGEFWGFRNLSANHAKENRGFRSTYQNLPWRGLKVKPEESE